MSHVKIEQLRMDEKIISKISLALDCPNDAEECAITLSGIKDIVATTQGTIKKNEILLKQIKKNVEVFIEPDETEIKLNVSYLAKGSIIHYEALSCDSQAPGKVESCHPLTIFTGGKGHDFFDQRIQNKLLKEWNATLTQISEEMIIQIRGNKKSTLVCLGTIEKNITAQDLSFILEPDIEKLSVPYDFLISHFRNQTIALHLLVKPDFQKKLKNIYYKSKISNEINIPDEQPTLRNLSDFQAPTGPFDPLSWIINYNTQLPEYIENLK